MSWIKNYQLFLFDFDGLLVNTEALHLAAYQQMLREQGFHLSLNQLQYCRIAHFESTGLMKTIHEQFPALKEIPWDKLRARKNQIYQGLVENGKIDLMPGSADLLEILAKENVQRCVVTHSKKEQIEPLIKAHPVLKTIPHWITRDQYAKPKPDPECYLKAISTFGVKKVIGFEDSPRGLQALLGTHATAVMVTPFFEKEELSFTKDFFHFDSFRELLRVDDLFEKKALGTSCKA